MDVISGTHDTDDGRLIAEWFAACVGRQQTAPYSAIGWMDEGVIRTAALFNDYNGANIEMHMFGRLGRHAIKQAFHYTFLQLKVLRVSAKPTRSNEALRDTLERMGFVLEGVMKRYYGPDRDDDAMMLRLDRSAAERWMS